MNHKINIINLIFILLLYKKYFNFNYMANYTFKCTNRKNETFTSDIFKSYYDNIIIENSNFIGCKFINCDFSKTKVLKSNIDNCTFENCIWATNTNKLNCELSNIVNCKEVYINEDNKFDKNKITIIKCNIIDNTVNTKQTQNEEEPSNDVI